MAVLKKKNQAVQKVVKKSVSARPQPTKSHESKDYIATVGRRKTSIARIRLYTGTGDTTINGKSVSAFFREVALHSVVFRPLDIVSKRDAVHFSVKVIGGGTHSQAGAIAHGLSRAILKADASHRDALRQAGLLTRDPRMKETRKIGTGGKARRAKQSPKR